MGDASLAREPVVCLYCDLSRSQEASREGDRRGNAIEVAEQSPSEGNIVNRMRQTNFCGRLYA